MTRRTIALAALAILAVAATAVAVTSRASYTTGSQSTVTATADSVVNWLSVDSQAYGGGLTGYAHQLNQPSLPLIADGHDAGLVIDWGNYPDKKDNDKLTRVFTIKTPNEFPVTTISQIRVTVTLLRDENNRQPLQNAYLHLTPGAGTQNWVDMGAGATAQLDITVNVKQNPWSRGDVSHPHVVLTVTFAGQTTAYYVYDFTTVLRIV